MDHKEQHHQHHEKEREEKKEHEKQHEHEMEKKLRVFHPLWFLVLGTVLILGVVYAWVFLY